MNFSNLSDRRKASAEKLSLLSSMMVAAKVQPYLPSMLPCLLILAFLPETAILVIWVFFSVTQRFDCCSVHDQELDRCPGNGEVTAVLGGGIGWVRAVNGKEDHCLLTGSEQHALRRADRLTPQC
jgi:hypothetical protein